MRGSVLLFHSSSINISLLYINTGVTVLNMGDWTHFGFEALRLTDLVHYSSLYLRGWRFFIADRVCLLVSCGTFIFLVGLYGLFTWFGLLRYSFSAVTIVVRILYGTGITYSIPPLSSIVAGSARNFVLVSQ